MLVAHNEERQFERVFHHWQVLQMILLNDDAIRLFLIGGNSLQKITNLCTLVKFSTHWIGFIDVVVVNEAL